MRVMIVFIILLSSVLTLEISFHLLQALLLAFSVSFLPPSRSVEMVLLKTREGRTGSTPESISVVSILLARLQILSG
jgi:hypothetical protein